MSQNPVSATIHTVDQAVTFQTEVRDLPPFTIDSHPPFGQDAGYTPLELLLTSLASCVSITLLTLIRGKVKREISDLQTSIEGYQREKHPKAFEQIKLHLTLTSPDLTEQELDKCLVSAEEKLCPVWAMLQGNVQVTTSYEIKRR